MSYATRTLQKSVIQKSSIDGSKIGTVNHEVPGSTPGSTMGIFPCRERFPL